MVSNSQRDIQTASVLVVDDEGANRYSVAKTLERVGYRITEAATGEEAVKAIDEQSFDVVLTDLRMPGIDGIELLRFIKEKSPDAVVILMTGYASLGSAVEALRMGAHDYLVKPSSSHDIRESVLRGVERAEKLKRRRRLLDAVRQDIVELTDDDFESKRPTPDSVARYPREGMAPGSYETMQTGASEDLKLGQLTVYTGRYQVSFDDTLIDLTPTEFDLLLYLAANRGRVVSCHELVREIRNYAVDEAEAREVIRPHISNLRRKMKKVGANPDIVVNVRGVGYRLSDNL